MTSVYSHNLSILLKIETNDRLESDDGFRLKIASQASPNKSWWPLNFFNNNTSQVAEIVNETCQRLFEQMVEKKTEPLTSTSLALEHDRIKARKVLTQVAKVGTKILNAQLQSDLEEFVKSPETLEARLALRKGIEPKVLNQTISGTYIMPNRQGKPWGIFKPQRQEVGSDKNPSWAIWASCRAEEWGIESGTGYLRECAAFRLDHDHFADVPLTVQTAFQHAKLDTSLFPLTVPNLIGSFQQFKNHCLDGSGSLKSYERFPFRLDRSWSSSLVEKVTLVVYRILFFLGLSCIPVDQIHKMAIFDIRILNCDRHLGNFLVDKRSKTLYPIDHGLILPSQAKRIRFEWQGLVQAHLPFSRKELEYIDQLDPDRDGEILKECGIPSAAIERMKLSTYLLKACAKRGLTLHQIADLMKGKVSPHSDYSFFEDVICKKVFNYRVPQNVVIDWAIDHYLSGRLQADHRG